MPRLTDAYSAHLRSQLGAYLKAGYAVAETDYEGLGTPGVHPYLIGSSEGRSVLDIVRAAREIDPRVGKSVAIRATRRAGTPRSGPQRWRRIHRRSSRCAGPSPAPASHIKDQSNLLNVITSPSPLSGLIASIFRGADVAFPAPRSVRTCPTRRPPSTRASTRSASVSSTPRIPGAALLALRDPARRRRPHPPARRSRQERPGEPDDARA